MRSILRFFKTEIQKTNPGVKIYDQPGHTSTFSQENDGFFISFDRRAMIKEGISELRGKQAEGFFEEEFSILKKKSVNEDFDYYKELNLAIELQNGLASICNFPLQYYRLVKILSLNLETEFQTESGVPFFLFSIQIALLTKQELAILSEKEVLSILGQVKK